MVRGKRKEAGAARVAEAKKAKPGLHEGDALPELPVLHDEADNPVQLMVHCPTGCLNVFYNHVVISCVLMSDGCFHLPARRRWSGAVE